ncbi:MAG: DUF2157 domain-containing protein [Deltaproteobacteria bacterium]|nr:DUF2157 domain-containing protein [Deltaproteobacteria bacterium]
MSVLESEATPARVRELVRRGALPTEQLDAALALVQGPVDARGVVRGALLFAGVTWLVAAAAYFIAAHWEGLSASLRLLLAAVVLVAVAALGAHLGPTTRGGRAATTMAALLVGPLLALLGQTYQTGVDPWQLFFGWTALALPFAVASSATAAWVVLVALAHVTVVLWLQQERGVVLDGALTTWLALASALVDVLGVFVVERVGARRATRGDDAGRPGRTERTGPRLALALLGASLVWADVAVLDFGSGWWLCLLASVGASAGLRAAYRGARHDLFALAVAGGNLVVLALCLTGYVLFEYANLDLFGLLLLGVVTLGLVYRLTVWLREQARTGTLATTHDAGGAQ